MTQGKTILIPGCGIGGLVAANNLRKALPKEHQIVVAEREARFLFCPPLIWLMTGLRTADNISWPLSKLEDLYRIVAESDRVLTF